MIQGTPTTPLTRFAQLALAACLAVPVLTQAPAAAQHANFVLFGDPNPKAAEVPKEQKHVAPLTSPYFNEDSFVTSDVRAWFLYQNFPKSSALGGGSAKVYAAQLRLALTQSIQFVAYKDGFINWDAGIIDDAGYNDIAAGLKWNFIQDWDNQFHAAVGAGYEIASGNGQTLNNDDEWRFWASADKGYDRLHLGGTVNFFFADDKSQGLGNADTMSWHLRGDYYANELFSPVVEINGYHVLNEGTQTLPFSGLDVVNLGGGQSEDVVTIGFGGELRPADNLAVRAAYETPLTKNDDLYGYRWTFSLVWSF
jgi:hypothetical protein